MGLKWAPEIGPEGENEGHETTGGGQRVLEELEAGVVG